MKIFRKSLLLVLIVAIFTSSGFHFVTKGVDKTVFVFNNVYSAVESFALKISQVSEVEYEEYYLTEPEFNSAYKSLNRNQAEIYKNLYVISLEMPDGFVKLCKKYDSTNRDISIAYNALLYDHSEIFWMPYTYILSDYSYGGNYYTAIAFNHDGKNGSTRYSVALSEREQMQKKLDKKVEQILAPVKDIKDEYELEKYFNDYICDNVEYVTEGFLVGTVYGALIENKAHCEGYSRAFKYLCNKVNIECDLVCGVSFGEGHMWNVVNIDGVHSNVDVTWNDRNDYNSYLYFNITDEQIKYDHQISPLHTKLSDEKIEKGSFNFFEKPCSYTGNTYYEKSGCILSLDYVQNAANKIQECCAIGIKQTEFLFTSKNTLSEFQKGDIQFIAKIQALLADIKIDSYIFERDVLILFYDYKKS